MKEDILNIQLTECPIKIDSNRNQYTNRRELNHTRECLIIVNALSLCIALCNQLGIKAVNRIIRMKLNNIHLFTTNNMFANW